MPTKEPEEQYDEAETVRRREDALKRMLSTPPAPRVPTKREKSETKN
jgi:hypothetical protein